MIDIKSLYFSELESFISENGFERFRAKQVSSWLNKGVKTFYDMKNLPKNLVDFLETSCYISVANIEKKLISRYDETVKYLFRLNDGEFVETVVMKYRHGYSICVSTQVGCKMGCTFCATGKSGFSRNLSASEILAQIESASQDLKVRISNIVLMGMGEPLDNFDNVVRFLKLVSADDGLNIGMRHITLSTCGIVPKIYELAKYNFAITLSVSLHAPDNETRNKTMPVNKRYPIEQLIKACRDYFNSTGRRVSFEYAMIDGVNDSDECAKRLSSLLNGMNCHVNLIPVNSVKGSDYKKSRIERQKAFINILNKNSVTATVRRTLGSDINASCGQLKRNHTREGGKQLGNIQ